MKLFLQAQSKARSLKERANNILANPKGMTMVEIIVLISVILVIGTVVVIFGDQIQGFLGRAGNVVDNLATPDV